MNPAFRICATGVAITGNAWWIGIHTVGADNAAPQFDPPNQARVLESFNQDRPGDDYWRWAGVLSGNRTIVRLNRGDCFDAYLPGDFGGPSIVIDNFAPGDWNLDGELNSNDISAFLTSWVASAGSPDMVGDYNLDGVVNSNDISDFLTAWLGG